MSSSNPDPNPTPELPKSYDEWTTIMLRNECRRRSLRADGVKYKNVRTLVEDDRKTRALQPRITYNDTNDPDGSLRAAQKKKDNEDKFHDDSASRAEYAYLVANVKRTENAVKRASEVERQATQNLVDAGIIKCPYGRRRGHDSDSDSE